MRDKYWIEEQRGGEKKERNVNSKRGVPKGRRANTELSSRRLWYSIPRRVNPAARLSHRGRQCTHTYPCILNPHDLFIFIRARTRPRFGEPLSRLLLRTFPLNQNPNATTTEVDAALNAVSTRWISPPLRGRGKRRRGARGGYR